MDSVLGQCGYGFEFEWSVLIARTSTPSPYRWNHHHRHAAQTPHLLAPNEAITSRRLLCKGVSASCGVLQALVVAGVFSGVSCAVVVVIVVVVVGNGEKGKSRKGTPHVRPSTRQNKFKPQKHQWS